MSFSTGVNRVLLVGRIGAEPHWQVINGQRMLYFRLSTTEKIKKDGGAYEHTEWHSIKVPAELLKDDEDLRPGCLVFVQGKLQTHIVFENQVKLYKTEVLVASIEKLKSEKQVLEILK
jgi:single-stranded DNA-binding protein